MRRPTIQDIADSVGFSKMTVSRSLRGIGRVNPQTRERVRKVARAMGYLEPTGVLGPLAHRGKTDHCLRLMVPIMSRSRMEVTGSYSQDVIGGIEERIAINGSGGGVEGVECTSLEEICQAWRDVRANGLVVRRLLPLRWMERLCELGPVVYAVSTDIMPDVDSAYTNEMRSAACLQRRLSNLKHKVVAWLGLFDHNAEEELPQNLYEEMSPMDRIRYSVLGTRYAAWDYVTRHTTNHAPVMLNRDWLRDSLHDAVQRGLEQVLALKPRPTAIVVPTNPMAAAVCQVAEEKGLNMPDDFSLICYCNSVYKLPNGQDCATVVLPIRDVGRAIPDLIERRLAAPESMPLTLMFQAELKEGDTLAPNA